MGTLIKVQTFLRELKRTVARHKAKAMSLKSLARFATQKVALQASSFGALV